MAGFNNVRAAMDKYPTANTSGGGDTLWMRLKEGSNRIRIVSEYSDFGVHFGGPKPSMCVGKDYGCPVCALIDKTTDPDEQKKYYPSARFLFWVVDYDDNKKLKLLEVGYSVVGKLEELAEDGDWPFNDAGIPEFNCTITKTKTGSRAQDVEYDVIPSPNGIGKPLDGTLAEEVAKLDAPGKIVEGKRKKACKDLGIDYAERKNEPAPAKAGLEVPKIHAEEDEIRVEDIPF